MLLLGCPVLKDLASQIYMGYTVQNLGHSTTCWCLKNLQVGGKGGVNFDHYAASDQGLHYAQACLSQCFYSTEFSCSNFCQLSRSNIGVQCLNSNGLRLIRLHIHMYV